MIGNSTVENLCGNMPDQFLKCNNITDSSGKKPSTLHYSPCSQIKTVVLVTGWKISVHANVSITVQHAPFALFQLAH